MNTNLFETFKYAKIKKSLKRRKEQDQAKTKYLKYRERSDKNIGEEDKLRVASSDKEALTERAKVFLKFETIQSQYNCKISYSI